ncbi:hypothetical protein LTR56_022007 [Elasticomyces elasticus]|nr:hypothetical protein LTR56_022007 [Elasticomyces elasticus]KAK3635023.1 hypothetical protein LTR22_019379 [Elasticomyces elasticus]KAK4915796.1 hypothetical protein LTR49_016165 [Elasticomyces elasticus]KAK5749458.1 hypothetical protein LTS12_020507 [Elasticomyces elasticus]
MDRPLHTDDIVSKKNSPTLLAVVERTPSDIDTHEPRPQHYEPSNIKCHSSISKPIFRRFLKDGVPPKNTVLVRWQHTGLCQLLPTSKLTLLDRSLLIGDVVRKNAQSAMSGVVINTFTTCTLEPVGDITYKNVTLKGLPPPSELAPDWLRPSTPPLLIPGVPASELLEPDTPKEEDLIIYKSWLGRVDHVNPNIVLKLPDNCVVEINEDLCEQPTGEYEAFAVGDLATTKKGNLRNGKWIFGRYNPNTVPVGTVVETRVQTLEISWLQRRIGGAVSEEPPDVLERDEIESRFFRVYDRTRRPLQGVANNTISNSELDIRLGLRVRFKDLAEACAKYPDTLRRIPRSEMLGYDINVFDIERFSTEVVVQWQDRSLSTEHSIDLIPDSSIEDEHATWPGEIAHSLDFTPVEGMEGVERPSRVGVVQSVLAGERMAKVRWAPSAVIHYARVEEEGDVRSLLTGAVGIADGEVEEVSLYEVEAFGAMNVRRGDLVLLAVRLEGGGEGDGDVDWVGEIVDTKMDGTLSVRLGAAREVRDVVLRREEVVVAVRSDGTDDAGHWDDGGSEEDEDEDEEVSDWSEATGVDGDSGMGGFDAVDVDVAVRRRVASGPGGFVEESSGESDDESESDEDDSMSDGSEEEPQARYEDENGEELDEEDVEGGDWESEDDDDDDDDMPDAPPGGVQVDVRVQATPPTSADVTPPDSTLAPKDDPATQHQPASETASTNGGGPPQYHVLEDAVPATHHYATSPSSSNPAHMKRVQKEHRILQKPSAIPQGIYIRTWESRLDLLRCLIIGPSDTPYENAPFVVDFHLPPTFPNDPPSAFFHSWSTDGAGSGRVNPNLYEDGKICLSLLGTWEGSRGEGWKASRSTMLQVVVSLLGLVLVKEPYFNEAGYEALAGLEESRRPSALYNERVYLRARGFVVVALRREGGEARGLEGLRDVVGWCYGEGGLGLLEKVIEGVVGVLERSEEGGGGEEVDGLRVVSKGVCIPLRRVLGSLMELR